MKNQEAIKILEGLAVPIHAEAAFDMAISALQALDEIYAFIMKSEASETTDGVLEIFDALQAQDAPDINVGDMISREELLEELNCINLPVGNETIDKIFSVIENMPSAQPESLSDAYTKAVWTWLLDYQIKAAELKGRYTPYEVLSWVANDWRKEHEGSD